MVAWLWLAWASIRHTALLGVVTWVRYATNADYLEAKTRSRRQAKAGEIDNAQLAGEVARLRQELAHGRIERALVTALLGGGIVVAVMAWLAMLASPVVPSLIAAAVFVAGVAVAGWWGRPDDDGQDVAVGGDGAVASRVTPIDPGMLVAALVHAEVPGVAKHAKLLGAEAVTIQVPWHKTATGLECVAELPPGVLASTVVARQRQMASALRIKPAGRLFLSEVDDGHPGTLRVTLADRVMADMDKTWPVRLGDRVDLFDGVPVGRTPDGTPFLLRLIEQAATVTGVQTMGKTRAMILIALSVVAAMVNGTRAKLVVIAGKGGGDWVPFERVCHRYVSTGNADLLAERAEAILDELEVEKTRRGELYEALAREDPGAPTRITPEIAEREGFEPIIVLIDEFAGLAAHPKRRKRIIERCRVLEAEGPALGIIVILGTQDSTGDGIPQVLCNLAKLRVGFKTKSIAMTAAALGEGAHGDGFRPTEFADSDKGLSWIIAPGYPTSKVQWFHVGPEETARFVAEATERLQSGGRLSGQAAGEVLVPQVAGVLDDVLVVMGDDKGIHPEEVLLRLRHRWERYSEWSADELRAEVGPLVKTKPMTVNGEKFRGWSRDDVEAARQLFAGLHVS